MHPIKKAARIAGAIYLSMVFTGPFSLIYVPNKLIVPRRCHGDSGEHPRARDMFRFRDSGGSRWRR